MGKVYSGDRVTVIASEGTWSKVRASGKTGWIPSRSISRKAQRREARDLERAIASPVISAAAWVKYLVVGSLDRTRRRVAHVQLAIAGQPLTTRLTQVALVDGELHAALDVALVAVPAPAPAPR